MTNETPAGSSGATDGGRPSPGRDGFGSPLQARAQFLKNWDWQSITHINRGSCERGRAQHGANSETHRESAEQWEKIRPLTHTLSETLDPLRAFHKRAPFLFFNGNTFATIARELALALFSDLSASRKSEISSAFGHYVAGVLDRDSMLQIVDALTEFVILQPGDRVKTFRGASKGVVVRVLKDGRVVWRSDESSAELIAASDSLLRI